MLNRIKNFFYKILRRSEKYTQTDMVYLAHGNFWLVSGQFISSLGTFLLAIFFANYLSQESYGTYKYVLSVASILAIANLSGIDGVVTQAVARGLEGSFIIGLKTKIKFGALGSVAALAIAIYYYIHNNLLLSTSFLIVGLVLPFMESFNIYDTFLLAKKQFKISAIYKTISQIASAAILIIVLILSRNPLLVILFYYLSWTLIRFILLKKTLKKFPPNKKQDPRAVNYGLHNSLIGVTSALISSADSLILFYYFGPIQLAVYSFAIAPISQLRTLFDKIPVLALPKVAQRSMNDIKQMFWKRFWLLFLLGALISAVYIISAPTIYHLFFPQYSESILYSQVYSVSMIFILCPAVASAVITSRLTLVPKKMLYLYNIPSIIFILAMLLTIPLFGVMGIVISRLLSSASVIIITIIIWEKIKKIEGNTTPNLSA